MSGDWITNQQAEVYMKSRQSGKTQVASAAKADISVRSGRNIEHNNRQDPRSKSRRWQTRQDPFGNVWLSELVPMLESYPELSPLTLLEFLQDKYPGEYPDSRLRTLQRRVKQWRSEFGPEREVMFRQEHHPGALGLSDFTKLKKIIVTIKGKPLEHLLYHFRLAYSGWSYMRVILGGESFTALAESLQEALWRLGGSPKEHRTDSLSAAFKNLSADENKDITAKYTAFCEHYSMKATRNNRGCSHENGGIESPHGHLKRRIRQAFMLRGNNDFESVQAYQSWLDGVVNNHNRRNAKLVEVERQTLQMLPQHKTQDYTDLFAKVTSSSTIQVRASVYTVPSRLIGQTLRVRLYHDRLECFLGSHHIVTLERVYGDKKKARARRVDYRHVIHSLIKKPQAFRSSQLREDLLPSPLYHKIWNHADRTMPPKQACKFIVGLLYLAATQDCEEELGWEVMAAISNGKELVLLDFQKRYRSSSVARPTVTVEQHALKDYNQLIPSNMEYGHA